MSLLAVRASAMTFGDILNKEDSVSHKEDSIRRNNSGSAGLQEAFNSEDKWILDENLVYAGNFAINPSVAEVLNKQLDFFNSNRKDNLRFYLLINYVTLVLATNVEASNVPMGVLQAKDYVKLIDPESVGDLIGQSDRSMKAARLLAAQIISKDQEPLIYVINVKEFIDSQGNFSHVFGDGLAKGLKLQANKALMLRFDKQAQDRKGFYLNNKNNDMGASVSSTIKEIIGAIEIEYDHSKEVDKGIDLSCAQTEDFLGTWPTTENTYNAAVEIAVKYLPLADNSYHPGSKFITIDERLKTLMAISTAASPGNSGSMIGFLGKSFSEALPSVLNLLPGKCDYNVKILFSEVDFYIPEGEERFKFAKTIGDKLKSAGSVESNDLLFVVPYFVCTNSAVMTPVFMPAAYGSDQTLTQNMSAAMLSAATIGEAFYMGLKLVPKDHISFIAKYETNGRLDFNGPLVEKRVPGYYNLVDIYVFMDRRIEMIQPYLNCMDEYQLAKKASAGMFDSREQNLRYDYLKRIEQAYTDCTTKSNTAILKIISENPPSKDMYVQLNAADNDALKFKFRQEILLGEDGFERALTYSRAAFLKAGNKVYNGTGGRMDTEASTTDTMLDDDNFYGKDNPYHVDHWIWSVVHTSSFIAGFLCPECYLFDLGLGVILYAAGEEHEAAMAFTNVALAGVVLPVGIKMAGAAKAFAVSTNAYKAVAKGASFFIRSGDRMLVAEAGKGLNSVASAITRQTGVVEAAGVVDIEVIETLRNDPIIRKKIEDGLVDIDAEGNVVLKIKEGQGPYQLRNDANDRNIVRRYAEALEAKSDLTFAEFSATLHKTIPAFKLGPVAESIGLAPEAEWCDLIVDGIHNGKVISKGKELGPKEVAELMKNGGHHGQPVRIVSLTPHDIEETKKFAEELAVNLDTKVETHLEDIKVSGDGIITPAPGYPDGTVVEWLETADYREVSGGLKELFRSGIGTKLEYAARADGRFLITPEVILPNGQGITCRINGKLTLVAVDDLARLMEQYGQRGDELIEIALTNNSMYKQNGENLPALAEAIGKRIDTRIQYPNPDAGIYYHSEGDAYDLLGRGSKPNDIDMQWKVVGKKKPLVLGTKENYHLSGIAESDKNVYVTISGITPEGKAIYYDPSVRQDIELNPKELLSKIKNHGTDLADKSIRLVPTGSVDGMQVQKFIGDLADLEAKVDVSIAKGPVNVAEGSSLPIDNITWVTHVKMGEGKYFLSQNISDAAFWKKLTDADEFNPEFVEKLGMALKNEGFGKYAARLNEKDYHVWIQSLYQDYVEFGKVSLPTYAYIRDIAEILRIESATNPLVTLDDLLIRAYNNNVSFSKNLLDQLRHLDSDVLAQVRQDGDLLKKAFAFFDAEMKNGKTLTTFIALENLGKKLDGNVVNSLSDKFAKDEIFMTSLAKETATLDDAAVAKLNRHVANDPDYLDEFKTLYDGNSTKISLDEFIKQSHNKLTLSFAGTDKTLQNIADQLIPQKETFCLIVKADGDGFVQTLSDGSLKLIKPKEMADLIKANANYVEGTPLRIVVDGTNDSDKTIQALVDHMDVDAQVYKGPLEVNEGKLLGKWNPISPDLPSNPTGIGPEIDLIKPLNDQNIISSLSAGGSTEDEAILQAVKRLKVATGGDRNVMYVVFHATEDGKIWIKNAEEWVQPGDIAKWLEGELGATNDVYFISCGTAKNSADPVQNIVNLMSPDLKVRYLAPRGNQFAQIGVDPSGQVVKLVDEPVEWMAYGKNQSPISSGKSISKGTDALPLSFVDDAVAITKPDLNQLVSEFKQANQDPFLTKLIDDAKSNNDTELLSDLLDGSALNGIELGASGKKYPREFPMLETKKIQDINNAKFIKVNAKDLPNYELKIKDGKFYVQGERLVEGETELYLFVMDKDGNIYVRLVGEDPPGAFFHSSFLPDKNSVACAGTLTIDAGKIIMTNSSGHFEPTVEGVYQTVHELTKRGVNIKKIELEIMAPRIRD